MYAHERVADHVLVNWCCLGRTRVDSGLDTLLLLPQACQIPEEDVQQLLDEAVKSGLFKVSQRLQKLPQASGLTVKFGVDCLLQQMRQAMDDGDLGEVVCLLNHPCRDDITKGVLAGFLGDCLSRCQKVGWNCSVRRDSFQQVVRALQQLPAFQALDCPSIVALMRQTIQALGERDGCLREYIAHPAAAAITADVAAELLHASLKLGAFAQKVWTELLQLPGAQSVDSAAVEGLFLECVKLGVPNCVSLLFGLPPLAHASAATAVAYLEACMRHNQAAVARVLLAELPSVQSLSQGQVHDLVQLSFVLGAAEIRTALLKLRCAQAAVKEDAVLQAVLSALEVQQY